MNWGSQGCLEIGHQFVKAKLSSWNWLDLTALHSKAVVYDYSLTLPSSSSSFFLATYWGTLLFIIPSLNLDCTPESSEEL